MKIRKINILLYLIALFAFTINILIYIYMIVLHTNEPINYHPVINSIMFYLSGFMVLVALLAFTISITRLIINNKKTLIDYWNQDN